MNLTDLYTLLGTLSESDDRFQSLTATSTRHALWCILWSIRPDLATSNKEDYIAWMEARRANDHAYERAAAIARLDKTSQD